MPASLDPRVSHAAGLLVVGAAVALSLSQLRGPQAKSLRQLRDHVVSLQQRIDQTQRLLLASGGDATWITQQLRKLRESRQRLPDSSQLPQLLDALLEQVPRANLQLINVNQGNLEAAKDAQERPIVLNLDETPCLRLPVTLTVVGRFYAVLAYLEWLASSGFPCIVNVERVHLTLNDPLSAQLNASIQLNLYVTGS